MTEPRTMLICDDEEELAHELGEYFTSAGWEVEVCIAAAAAIDRLQRFPAPQVLITDLRIGAVDGREVVAAARALPKDGPPPMIVIITGHVMNSAVAADFDSDTLCVKPIDPEELSAAIESFLRLPPT